MTDPAIWEIIKKEYILTDLNQRQLAGKYDVAESSLSRHAITGKWREQREKKREKTMDKSIDAAAEAEARRAERLSSSAERLLGRIDALIDGGVDLTPRDIRDLTTAIRDIRLIFDVRRDADLREQEARIRKLEREAERGEETGAKVTVTFSPEIEELAK